VGLVQHGRHGGDPGRHAREARALEALLQRSLPQLDYVLGRVEAAGLPTTFALLPLVESGFRALPSRGNRPAGAWQFMPATAREHGLRIEARRDDRLDLVAATEAAIRLLRHLLDAFEGDPRLATMAFNTGEFRVRRALRSAGLRPGADDLSALRLGATTRGHLARLQALACLVAAPAQAGVSLPALPPDEALRALPLDAELDLALAARLSGTDLQRLRALNPSTRGATLHAGQSLLLPAPAQRRLAERLPIVPPSLRVGWRPAVARPGDRWDTLIVPGIDVEALAAVNDRRPDDALPRELLVPAPPGASPAAADTASDGTYVVRSGDSLWRIARRFGVALEHLLRHNGLAAARTLRPGQVLRIPAP
jgi:membrane-bound lytic murein transglycosylase D